MRWPRTWVGRNDVDPGPLPGAIGPRSRFVRTAQCLPKLSECHAGGALEVAGLP